MHTPGLIQAVATAIQTGQGTHDQPDQLPLVQRGKAITKGDREL